MLLFFNCPAKIDRLSLHRSGNKRQRTATRGTPTVYLRLYLFFIILLSRRHRNGTRTAAQKQYKDYDLLSTAHVRDGLTIHLLLTPKNNHHG